MKEIFDQLSAQCSKLTTRKYSTSFSLGIRFLNEELHGPIYAIYGFVRLADEVVDSFHGYDKAHLLKTLREDCFQAIAQKISLNPILNSFQQTVNRYGIEQGLIEQFLHSMEMDLIDQGYDQCRYEEYILGSAEVVGLMCLSVFTGGDRNLYAKLRAQAMRMGAGFQKINFLRDIGVDFQQLNRSYFPDVDLTHFTEKDKIKIEQEIEDDFCQGLNGIRALPRSSRCGVFLAYAYYRQLFEKIKRAEAKVIFSKRYRVSNGRKLLIMLSALAKNKLNWI